MTVSEATKQLKSGLETIYDEREATNIAHLVLEKITSFPLTQQRLKKLQILTAEQQDQLESFKQQLLHYKPVQYVLNEAWFAGSKFYVDENVLIPRPETEELVQLIIDENKNDLNRKSFIIDIGTGSGCIAVTLKKKLSNTQVYALDISKKVIDIAQINSTQNNVSLQFIEADILNFKHNKLLPVFDIIVSNPPYVQNSEAATMFQNVLKYEPHIALFVPNNDALIFYKAIADFSLKYINKNGGKLYVEINETLGESVVSLFTKKGFTDIKIKKDMQQKNRFVTATLYES